MAYNSLVSMQAPPPPCTCIHGLWLTRAPLSHPRSIISQSATDGTYILYSNSRLKEPREKTLHDYLFGIHEDFLFKICEGEDSSNGLKGLEYYGGPEVTCSNDERRCEWKAVIPCVRYQGGVVTSKVELLSCDECGRAPNIQEWLVRMDIR